MTPSSRVGCSTISFQHLTLTEALREITRMGFTQIDLGALPGVVDHVPFPLDDAAISDVAATIAASGVTVRSVNGDVGDFNLPLFDRDARDAHLDALLRLTAAIGAPALVLPCGGLGHEPVESLDADLDRVAKELRRAAARAATRGVEIWVESLHFLRFCGNRARAEALHQRLEGSGVRPILDVAHVVAADDDLTDIINTWPDIAHVHIRDAAPGDFNRPFPTGTVDFARAVAALEDAGYRGTYALELPSAAYSDSATDALSPEAHQKKVDLVQSCADHLTYLLANTDALKGASS